MTPADRILDRETADLCDVDADLAHDLSAPVACTGCRRPHPRYALDTTGRCPTCPAADAHRCVIREGARSLVTLALAILTGAYLTTWDHAIQDERADARRDAWIAALEAETATQWAGVVRADECGLSIDDWTDESCAEQGVEVPR